MKSAFSTILNVRVLVPTLPIEALKPVYRDAPGHVFHGVQRRMISVDIFFVFLRLFVFALLLLYVT